MTAVSAQAAARHLADTFRASVMRRPRRDRRWIGLEMEYPIIDAAGRAASPHAVRAVFAALEADGWIGVRDGRGTILGVRRTAATSDGGEYAEALTTDMGAATLEIQFAPAPTVALAAIALTTVHDLIRPALAERGLAILGYGAHPVEPIATAPMTPKERYAQILRGSPLESDGGRAGRRICMSASSQVHVDVSVEEAAPLVSILNATAGPRIALLANSPHVEGLSGGGVARRELFWDEAYGDRPGQTGTVGPFVRLEDYASHLVGLRGFLVERDGRYYRLETAEPMSILLERAEPLLAFDIDGRTHRLRLRSEDVCEQYGLGWFAARLNPYVGTVEDRIACQQPPEDQLVAAAFVLGLAESAAAVAVLVATRSFADWQRLRVEACRTGLSGGDGEIAELANTLVNLAASGLSRRGLDEQAYLDPLYHRLRERRSPADRIMDQAASGRLDWIRSHLTM